MRTVQIAMTVLAVTIVGQAASAENVDPWEFDNPVSFQDCLKTAINCCVVFSHAKYRVPGGK